MNVLSKEKIKELYAVNLIYEIHRVTEKIRLFEKKYQMKFKEFEEFIKSMEEEKFELWDDFMEWKGYEKKLQELMTEKERLDAGDYTLS